MGILTQAGAVRLRFDNEETILGALEDLQQQGVDIFEAESRLVRIAPTDLDLLADILGQLRRKMAANDPAFFSPLIETGAAPNRRYGRFAQSG